MRYLLWSQFKLYVCVCVMEQKGFINIINILALLHNVAEGGDVIRQINDVCYIILLPFIINRQSVKYLQRFLVTNESYFHEVLCAGHLNLDFPWFYCSHDENF